MQPCHYSNNEFIKWALIWLLIFEVFIIIEYEFISYFVVVVYYFTIFDDIISINLSLLFLTQ